MFTTEPFGVFDRAGVPMGGLPVSDAVRPCSYSKELGIEPQRRQVNVCARRRVESDPLTVVYFVQESGYGLCYLANRFRAVTL